MNEEKSDFQKAKNNVTFTLKELQDYLESHMDSIDPEDYSVKDSNMYYQDRGYNLALGNLFDILEREAEFRVDYEEKDVIGE